MQLIFHFDRFLHSICRLWFIVMIWIIHFSIWKAFIVFLRHNWMKFRVGCLCTRYVSNTVPIELLHFGCEFLNISKLYILHIRLVWEESLILPWLILPAIWNIYQQMHQAFYRLDQLQYLTLFERHPDLFQWKWTQFQSQSNQHDAWWWKQFHA